MSEIHWKPAAKELEKVACPLCGGSAFTPLAWTDRYDMDLVTAGCNGCGLVMTNPQPTAGSLDEFYREHYRRYYQKTDVPDLAYIRQYRKDERAATTAQYFRDMGLLHAQSRVLDIGASEGCILKAVGDLEPASRRVAVEPNPTFGAFAVVHAGCTLHPSVEELRSSSQQGPFDLIVINHVYEHVKHPADFLAGLKQMLAPSTGRIYIDVPDITAYLGLESLHIAHLYHFGPDSLRRAAACAGYAVESLDRHQPIMHPPSLRCILRADPAAAPSTIANRREGWTTVRQAGRLGGRYHRKRWSLARRVRHFLWQRAAI
jgi:hypothetical protein